MKKFTPFFPRGIIFSFLLIVASQNYAATIYVNSSAAGSNNGTSWTNAFTSLTSALSIALSGDEIWLAQGVYKPSVLVDFNANGGTDLREAAFSIPNGVAIYGGFDGTEDALNLRNWESHPTILSGDIDNNDINADADFIAESTSDLVGNNAYHVVYTQNVGTATRLDGLIITAGSANILVPVNVSDPNLDGGGWLNQLSSPTFSSSPTVINTTFSGNFAKSEGGAFYHTPGPISGEVSSLIENCNFINNKSDLYAGALYMGSYSLGNYNPVINNCIFSGNVAYRHGGAIQFIGDHAQFNNTTFNNNQTTAISPDGSTLPASGGGVNLVGSNAEFNNCMFKGNSATGNPTGAFEGGGGGAVYLSTNEPQTNAFGAAEIAFISCGFYNNTVGGNTAAWGGAAVHKSDGGILRVNYVNCVFSGNEAQTQGGAIANFTRVMSNPEGFSPALEPAFTNCTFTNNHAGNGGGAIHNAGYVNPVGMVQLLNTQIENCILWNNSATSGSNEIFNSGNNTIRASLIEGSGGSGAGWDISLGTDGGNNIDENPDFVNSGDPDGADNLPATTDDGLQLSITSPAIDAGNTSAAGLAGITTDYIGNLRVQGSDVDMGAYDKAGLIIPDLDVYWIEDWRDWIYPCLTCPPPWTILIYDYIFAAPEFLWKGKAKLTIDKKTATIEGEIVNRKDPGMGFKVYLKLEQQANWEEWSAMGGTYFALTPEARKIAIKEHFNYIFWTLSSESYFEGTGNISGTIYLQQWPTPARTGFQLGLGANAWDRDLGMAGFYYYKGRLKTKDGARAIRGLGSFNADATLCKEGCTPTRYIQNDEIENTTEKLAEVFVLGETEFVIYPVPASDFLSIEINSTEPENYTLQIFDINGSERYRELLISQSGKINMSLTDFKPGIYLLKLVSNNDKVVIRKLIIEK